MKKYESNVKKPSSILLQNSKKFPLNINEIDIDLIMSNPKTIHSFMDKEQPNLKYKDELPLMDLPKHLRHLLSYRIDSKSEPKKKHRTVTERLDKTQANMYKKVDKGIDAVTTYVKNFKNDVNDIGFGPTVMGRVSDGKDLINEFISREEFDNVRGHLKKEPKKPEAKALNALLKRQREIDEKYLKNRS